LVGAHEGEGLGQAQVGEEAPALVNGVIFAAGKVEKRWHSLLQARKPVQRNTLWLKGVNGRRKKDALSDGGKRG